MSQKQLHEMEFVDLYVCLEGNGAPHYRKFAGEQAVSVGIDIPEEFLESVSRLTEHLRVHFTDEEMGLAFEGTRLRAARARTSNGQMWAALRKINGKPLAVDKLGFNQALIPHLHALGKRDGLVLICGSTGHGKTTTACSLMVDFLEQYGGVAFTIEDPVEYALDGRHGQSGRCYQVEVKEDHEWAEMLKRSLRWHPRYILVGEIRTPDVANLLLRAATSGHLVLATVHAGTIEEALEGLLHLAEQSVGDRASLLLATGITAVVHQTFTQQGVQAQFFITEPFNPAAPFRACIRDKRIGQTRTLIDQQVALMMQGSSLFRRVGDT